jgi:sugar/nucleoside kinase (ribokinase family)
MSQKNSFDWISQYGDLLTFILYFREKLRRANVQFLSAPIKDATTGTVIVLTTPDAQRTMLAYQVRYYYK